MFEVEGEVGMEEREKRRQEEVEKKKLRRIATPNRREERRGRCRGGEGGGKLSRAGGRRLKFGEEGSGWGLYGDTLIHPSGRG